MRFVDTYLEDVSTVDITATYVNLLGAIPVVGDHVVVWSRAIGILSPFLFATQKFNLIVGALSQFIDKNMAFVGINYPARLKLLQFLTLYISSYHHPKGKWQRRDATMSDRLCW